MGMEEEDEELKKLMSLKTMGVITPLGWWKAPIWVRVPPLEDSQDPHDKKKRRRASLTKKPLKFKRVTSLSISIFNLSLQQVEISNQQVVWHIVDFKMIWKIFAFAFAFRQKSIGCFYKSIGCFSENLNRIMLSGFNIFLMILTVLAP